MSDREPLLTELSIFSICLIMFHQQQERLQQVGCCMFYWLHVDSIYLLQEIDMNEPRCNESNLREEAADHSVVF